MKYIYVLSVVFMSIGLYAMDTQSNRNIIIIDYNEGDSLERHLDSQFSSISIFGAIPSYGEYEQYISLLTKHSQEIMRRYKPNKHMKGVSQATQELVRTLKEDHDIDLAARIQEGPFEQQVDLFLDHGFKNGLLAKNMRKLLNIASTSSNALIHILLPSDSDHMQKYVHMQREEDREKLYTFLKCSARFYRQRYERCGAGSQLPVYIVIPLLDQYKKSMQCSDKYEGIVRMLLKACEPLSHIHYATIIGQNIKESRAIVKYAREQDIASDCLRISSIFEDTLKPVFHPPVINPQGSYHFGDSPVITRKLLSYFSTKEIR
jgi:hypothetical protein